MIKLYQFAPSWGMSASPFCLKLETYLRMTGLPYEIAIAENPGKAPKGKLPYIEDNGKIVADSNFVIDYLKTTYGNPLDTHLSASEQAIALAIQRLIEENFYWALVYSRWQDPANWEKTKAAYFSFLPPILSTFVPNIAKKKTLQALCGHGMGKHNQAEVYEIGVRDLTAIAHFLEEKPFMLGNRPTTLDASAYAFVVNILRPPIESPLKQQAQSLPNLKAYCDRMEEQFY
jgi:glutathione S-transferase